MNKALLLNLILCFTLTACGGGGDNDSPADNGDGKSDITDTTPDDFSFTDLADQELSVVVTSNEVTLNSIDDNTAISIENGQYSVSGGELLAEAGKVNAGDTITVVLTTATDYAASATATLTVGTLSVDFNATTRVKDIKPEAFAFTAIGNAELNTDLVSNEITLTALDNNTAISISTGAYRINSGEFTSAEGAVNSGDKVSILLTSSSAYENVASTTLTVGTVSSTFNIITRAQDSTPTAFSFSAQENIDTTTQTVSNTITLTGIDNGTAISIEKGSYSINGGDFITQASQVNEGDTLAVRVHSANGYETQTQAEVTVGTSASTFIVTTRAKDITPTAFSFSAQENINTTTQTVSNTITLAGIDSGTAISIENGSYSINSGDFITQASQVNAGDTLAVRVQSANDYETQTQTDVTVGTSISTFSVTTREKDITPNTFEFASVVDAELNSEVASNTVTISGIDDATPFLFLGSKYTLNGVEATGGSEVVGGSINNGDELTLYVMTGANFNTQYQAAIAIGGEHNEETFSATTRANDITPVEFEFTTIEDSEISTDNISNTITLAEIDDETDISITSGMYSVNGSEFTSEAGKVKEGDTLALKITSADEFDTLATANLTVGDFSASYQVTTRNKDTNPNYTGPASVTDAALNSYVESSAITFTEFDGDEVTIIGAEYKLNDAEWTEAGETELNEGDVLILRVFSASTYSTQVSSSVGGNGWLSAFRVTTMEDITPTVSFNKVLEEDGSTPLNGSEELVLTFSEAMQIDTLNLSGDMVPDCNDLADETSCLNIVWSEGDTVLTLSPQADFYWYSDVRSLQLAITGDGTLGLDETVSATVLPVFETFQAADVVIGQSDFNLKDYDTTNVNFRSPTGIRISEDNNSILIADSGNARIVRMESVPTVNGSEFTSVFGQLDFDSRTNGLSDDKLYTPMLATEVNGDIYITENRNNRALTVDLDDFSSEGSAQSVIGQDDFYSNIGECDASSLDSPDGMEVLQTENGTQWIVSDLSNHRIMIWNNYEAAIGGEASIVLGQASFDDCTKQWPDSMGLNAIPESKGVWTNGEKLIVASGDSNRLLVWNTFPTSSGEQPDFQLGQENDFEQDANSGQATVNQAGFYYPWGVGGNTHQICLSDYNNNRVLIWSSLPESNSDLADIVIGQSSFNKGGYNDTDQDGAGETTPSATTLSGPKTCDISFEQLFVVDGNNHRALIYNALNKHPGNN